MELYSNTFINESKKVYDRPYSAEQIKKKYGNKVFENLAKDPVHKWRMDTGIELIHKEPGIDELIRIMKNWDLMSPKQKSISDEKSIELFGMTNKEHFEILISEYK